MVRGDMNAGAWKSGRKDATRRAAGTVEEAQRRRRCRRRRRRRRRRRHCNAGYRTRTKEAPEQCRYDVPPGETVDALPNKKIQYPPNPTAHSRHQVDGRHARYVAPLYSTTQRAARGLSPSRASTQLTPSSHKAIHACRTRTMPSGGKRYPGSPRRQVPLSSTASLSPIHTLRAAGLSSSWRTIARPHPACPSSTRHRAIDAMAMAIGIRGQNPSLLAHRSMASSMALRCSGYVRHMDRPHRLSTVGAPAPITIHLATPFLLHPRRATRAKPAMSPSRAPFLSVGMRA
ncbi:hypothetical protein BS50DRAFT_41156 [Corynespora cassiicola Philippines]|uniref:Uncharacterized protein n=1 Tax=Corynespora cassiicola Philippines TaxID=1448308 RepID=A0A2T2PCX5_CORCC|nr:hypothetical protein BS50DRAFT_41156 [Corynespora cassiicola Philippines]